jgi:RNA polymerase sigma-70 factor (ECF subfamily)
LERCVRAYRAGDDPEAQANRIVQILSPRLGRLLARQQFARDAARDLAQEILFRVFHKIDEYRFHAPFGAWVRTVAVHTVLNHRRHGRIRERHLVEVPLERGEIAGDETTGDDRPEACEPPRAEARVLDAEAQSRILEAIATLPPAMRRCLLLRVVHDLKYRHIASILGVTLNAVRSQISHGYRRLEPLLASYFPERIEGED